MEQPCYKCGQTVEEGIPFCPHCSAPQIRVMVAEPVPPAALADQLLRPRQASLPASQTVPVLALPMQWSQALKPCVLAELVASGSMLLGLHPFVAMVSVGFLAVIFYRQRRPEIAIDHSRRERVWVLCGSLLLVDRHVLTLIASGQVSERELRTDSGEDSGGRFSNQLSASPSCVRALQDPEGLVLTLSRRCISSLCSLVLLGALAALWAEPSLAAVTNLRASRH